MAEIDLLSFLVDGGSWLVLLWVFYTERQRSDDNVRRWEDRHDKLQKQCLDCPYRPDRAAGEDDKHLSE